MNDPRIEIAQFAKKEEAAVKAWFGSNWVPYLLGFLSAMLVAWIAHKL